MAIILKEDGKEIGSINSEIIVEPRKTINLFTKDGEPIYHVKCNDEYVVNTFFRIDMLYDGSFNSYLVEDPTLTYSGVGISIDDFCPAYGDEFDISCKVIMDTTGGPTDSIGTLRWTYGEYSAIDGTLISSGNGSEPLYAGVNSDILIFSNHGTSGPMEITYWVE